MRGNRRLIILTSVVVLILAIGLGGVLLINGTSNAACHSSGTENHLVTISNDKPSETSVQGNMCDTLTFKNEDDITREIAFGPHENHVPYDGVAEHFLNKGQSFTITLNQAGTFRWHDHIHDEVQGYFKVMN